MKKIFVAVLLLSMFLGVFSVCGQAYRLSYATNCLAQGIELVKSGIYGQDITFNDADIKQALSVTGFDRVTICSLPKRELGVLKLGNVEVSPGQVITRENIDKLVFTPATPNVEEADFGFSCDKLCGGATITCKLRFTDKVNQAPTTAGVKDATLHVWTQKNVTVFGTMMGSDPENDEITYMVVSYPKKGTLEVMNATLGDFKYTPKSGFRGTDRFSYVARDSFGNYSAPTEVNIRVGKRLIDITYSDMQNSSATNAAMVMEAKKIMQGKIEGDGYYFFPSASVTKEDFVVMAMKALGIAPKADAVSSFFDDDKNISEPNKNYIATAQRYGYIVGEFSGKELLFHPKDSITRGEAAVVMARMMGLTCGESQAVWADAHTIPVWARNEMSTLYQMGVFTHSAEGNIMANAPLTRAQAAQAFLAVMEEFQ